MVEGMSLIHLLSLILVIILGILVLVLGGWSLVPVGEGLN